MLQGKVAVVTGGAQGIGYSIAAGFVRQGASVLIADIDQTSAERSARMLGDSADACSCDVTDIDSMRAAVDRAVAAFGSLDVMVNNAGITRDASMRKMTVDQFDQVISVHLRGTWLGTKIAADSMRSRAVAGSIINMSSISGKVGMVGQTNYSAAKAGIVGLTKSSAKELARFGIRVNAIQPGLIRTTMTEAMPRTVWDQKLAEIPMARPGEPEEVADVATFLASDLSSYMTGATLEVAGGRLM